MFVAVLAKFPPLWKSELSTPARPEGFRELGWMTQAVAILGQIRLKSSTPTLFGADFMKPNT